jgi:hypothetical protein
VDKMFGVGKLCEQLQKESQVCGKEWFIL